MIDESGHACRLNKWLGAGASASGRGHIARSVPCQDACLVILEKNVAIAVVSDGAGSATYSHHGAKTAVACAARVLTRTAPWTDVDAVRRELLNTCRDQLAEKAAELGCNQSQLACTILFAAVQDGDAVMGNLGDGVVAAYEGDKVSRISTQTKGEFVNETVFITTKAADQHLEIHRLDATKCDGFVLLTDGGAESLYLRQAGTMAPAVAKMLRWLEENTSSSVGNALLNSALPMLTARTTDDCTVALLKRVSVNTKELERRDRAFQLEFLNAGNWLGLKNRLRVLRANGESRDVSEIASLTGLSIRTVLGHLRAMRRLSDKSD